MNTPKIPASAVVLRVIAILGMGLTFSAFVLLIVAAEWLLAGIFSAAFFPFMGVMYFVDRLWLAAMDPNDG
jgi:hypothetical protein